MAALATAAAPANDVAVLTGIESVVVVARSLPPPKDDEVQVAVAAVGICGSDLAYWARGVAGGFRELDFSKKGLVTGYCGQMGHECSGTVVAVGARVASLAVGARVALEPGVPGCGGDCASCRAGRYNLCEDMRFIGSAVNATPGALGRRFNHRAAFCYELPDAVSLAEGAMFEPLCVALHAVTRARVAMGDRVLVTGAGPIGLMVALAAKAAGAATVVVTDVVPAKLCKALEIGVDAAYDARDAATADVLKAKQFDRCFECSGFGPTVTTCVIAAKSGGVVCLVANHKPEVAAPLQELARREVDLVGVYRYRNLYPTARALVASGKIDLKPLISRTFTLAETNDAFKYFATGEPIKVLIMPNGRVE